MHNASTYFRVACAMRSSFGMVVRFGGGKCARVGTHVSRRVAELRHFGRRAGFSYFNNAVIGHPVTSTRPALSGQVVMSGKHGSAAERFRSEQ